jgi:hypothetical protein
VGLGRFAAHRRGRLTRTSGASTHSGRVRHRTLTVRRRYTADQDFRAICDEYVLARRALAHWNAVDPPCQQREQEYWRLVRELEDEIVAALVGRP